LRRERRGAVACSSSVRHFDNMYFLTTWVNTKSHTVWCIFYISSGPLLMQYSPCSLGIQFGLLGVSILSSIITDNRNIMTSVLMRCRGECNLCLQYVDGGRILIWATTEGGNPQKGLNCVR
jgi:hypothetical protein